MATFRPLDIDLIVTESARNQVLARWLGLQSRAHWPSQ